MSPKADNNETPPSTPSIHLLCNAHLDPVWLWEWEEGAAEALGTFRSAADLCEEFDGFVFNHNEVILYQWVEEYEPALFERIQRLVQAGKWHIMGGWYLQPDCNMPAGESFARQILLGRRYFQEKFGVRPTTAINFDSFGHTRGLVQIMARSGFDGYIFCRPGQEDCPLDAETFVWEGYDGSQVLGVRGFGHYLSHLGQARAKVERLMEACPDFRCELLLWGVGNHGGGPSRQDLNDLADLIAERDDLTIQHSTPETFFAEIRARGESLPVRRQDLNPWGVGCYTSQVRIKQKHRQLENELYATEKMAAAASMRGALAYPQAELQEAMRDLATAEFHDILPGSSIQPAEEMGMRLLDHGLELLSRVRARTFFALARNQPKAPEGEIPILVYNPHPFSITRTIECEFQLADQNWDETFTQVTAYRDGEALPTQVEKELSNLNLDWRKRVVFSAELAPAQMNRFDCRLTVLPEKPKPTQQIEDGRLHFRTERLDVIINAQTGLLDRYRVDGIDYLAETAARPLVIADNADPWGSRVRRFREVAGAFALLSPEKSAQVSGVDAPTLPPVRVIEDGPVRTVVEAVFGYGDSFICQRYKLPKVGTEIEVEVRVHWNEKDRMLKLSLPTPDPAARFSGQVAFGVADLPDNGDEAVAQKWVAVLSEARDAALTVIDDGIYGADYAEGELRVSLLRSSAYAALPLRERRLLPQDRYSPRIDQGERLFRFWLNGGPVAERLALVDREALAWNERPMALSFFPAGGAGGEGAFMTLSDPVVQLSALKRAEDGDGLIVRLFEPSGQGRETTVRFPDFDFERSVSLAGFAVRTFRVDPAQERWVEVNLVEEG